MEWYIVTALTLIILSVVGYGAFLVIMGLMHSKLYDATPYTLMLGGLSDGIFGTSFVRVSGWVKFIPNSVLEWFLDKYFLRRKRNKGY